MTATERSNEAWLRDLPGRGPAADAARRELEELVRRAIVKATAARGLEDGALLDDLTQVAVVRVLDHLDRFEGRSRFTTWAWSVAVRAAFGELRRPAYRSSGEALEEGAAAAASGAGPAQRAEQAEIVEVMHRVIDEELTARQRTALLGELAGTSREELLATLGIGSNAFHKLTHDARARLKRGLAEAGICDDQVREAFGL